MRLEKGAIKMPPQLQSCTLACIDADPIRCLSERHQAGEHLSYLMGGCSCRCHFDAHGGWISPGQWQINRSCVVRNRAAWTPGPEEVK